MSAELVIFKNCFAKCRIIVLNIAHLLEQKQQEKTLLNYKKNKYLSQK
jgi:hypothetical protein